MRSLLAVWLVLCVALASTAVLDPHGAMTPDSANYCRVASGIASGNGPTVVVGTERLWYSTHPPAYPAAIAVVHLLTGVSTFWASKLVQMLCMLGILVALRKPLGAYALVLPILMVCDATWTLFLYSWSEPLFILSAVLVGLALASLWERPTWSAALMLALASSVGILTRYSGIAIPLVMVVTAILALRARKNAWMHITLATIICGIAGATDIWYNVHRGYSATGIRQAASESVLEIAGQLAQAMIRPLVFIPVPNGPWKLALYGLQALFVVVSAIIIVRSIRHRALFRRATLTPRVATFLGLGLAITAVTVLPRFAVAMDTIGLRFVAPGAFLCAIGMLFWWKEQEMRLPRPTTVIMITSVILVCGTAVRSKSWLIPYGTVHTYLTTQDSVLQKYRDVPDSSIVLFGNDHIRYLRPSIHTDNPLTTPWARSQESMTDFLKRMHTYRPRGVFMDTVRDVDIYHPSVRAFADSLHNPSVIVRLW